MIGTMLAATAGNALINKMGGSPTPNPEPLAQSQKPAVNSMSLPGVGDAAQKTFNSFGSRFDKAAWDATGLDQVSAGARGKESKSYMDAAFPGTNPWERLKGSGGSTGGAGLETRNQFRVQEKLQNAQLSSQQKIAERNNKSQIISSLGQVSPKALTAGLSAYGGKQPGSYGTQTQISQEKLASEIANIKADTQTKKALTLLNNAGYIERLASAQLKGTQNEVEKIMQSMQEELNKARIFSDRKSNMWKTINHIVEKVISTSKPTMAPSKQKGTFGFSKPNMKNWGPKR